MTSRPDDPTEILDGDDEEPTGHLESGTAEEPTEHLEPGTEQTEEMRTRRLAANPPPPPESPDETPPTDKSRRRGINMLVGSIAAALILVGGYIAAGGLDYKPSATADPCNARAWTNPGNFDETVQQLAFSAVDGAACDLGVSREELTRALADDASRQKFQEDNNLSDSQVEDATRAGLNRAIDDAEAAGAIGGITVTALRAAARFLPVDQLIPLIQNASSLLDGQSTNDIGGAINGVLDALGGGSSQGGTGTTGDKGKKNQSGDLQDQIENGLDGLLNP
ncbi:MAG: hypothetical protein IPK93_07840 [Solirubrobacterales bacterium]|nr:hypothetical protein [Solirubrobacterales bacterium]